MITSLKFALILMLACVASVKSAKVNSKFGPGGMSFDDTTNCSQFSKFGRFNPYSVLHEKWFVFFYWAPPKTLTTYVFTFPTANHTKHLKKLLNGNTILPVIWSARQILMEDHNNETSLLVERGDRGEYWRYPLYKVTNSQKISPRDVRLKQTGDNRILGFMDCVDETLMVMSRINDVPPKNRLQEEASRLGYRGRRGKSYLYQGHEWVPIPEDDEKNYWAYNKPNKGPESSKETKSSEQSEEEGSQPTNEPNDSKKKNYESSQVTYEEEVKSRCTKIEPELWDDPKPEATKDSENRLLTREELENLETGVIDTLNTQYIEVPDTTSPIIQENEENDFVKESKGVIEENNEQNEQQDEFEQLDPFVDKGFKSMSESTNQLDDDCTVCYDSSVHIHSTSKPYIPDNLHVYTNLKNEPSSPTLPAEPVTPQTSSDSTQGTNSSSFIILSPQTIDDLDS